MPHQTPGDASHWGDEEPYTEPRPVLFERRPQAMRGCLIALVISSALWVLLIVALFWRLP